MIVLGLTGAMAAGKTTVAKIFRHFGVPVFDADAAVRALQAPGGAALEALEHAFPGIVRAGRLDRAALRQRVTDDTDDSEALTRLEAIMHPLVRAARQRFLADCRERGEKLCLLDIPLLWETGADRDCDAILLVDAPLATRLARLRKRQAAGTGMSVAEARRLMTRQMTDGERRRRADIVIRTGASRAETVQQIGWLLRGLRTRPRQTPPSRRLRKRHVTHDSFRYGNHRLRSR